MHTIWRSAAYIMAIACLAAVSGVAIGAGLAVLLIDATALPSNHASAGRW